MRTTIALDDELIRQAEHYTGIKEKAALVRETLLNDLSLLVQAPVVRTDELFTLVELRRLYRITDLHLVASALFDRSLSIWTRDRRLGDVADELGIRAAIA